MADCLDGADKNLDPSTPRLWSKGYAARSSLLRPSQKVRAGQRERFAHPSAAAVGMTNSKFLHSLVGAHGGDVAKLRLYVTPLLSLRIRNTG